MRLSFEDEAQRGNRLRPRVYAVPASVLAGYRFSGRTDNPRCAGHWMTAKALEGMVEEIANNVKLLAHAQKASGSK
jgi:hypothetical protein